LQFATNNVVVQTITSAGATTFSGNVGIAGNLVAATSTIGVIQLGGGSTIYGGTGIPSFSAPGGSIFLRYDGAINARLYVNQASSTSNTSWIPVNGV
jgi:hypothetical protein